MGKGLRLLNLKKESSDYAALLTIMSVTIASAMDSPSSKPEKVVYSELDVFESHRLNPLVLQGFQVACHPVSENPLGLF